MKASELRIGNLVFDDEGMLSKINGFQPYGYSIRCDEEEGCELLIDLYPQDGTIKKGFEVDINLCKPIPLIKKWLLNFGFKESEKDCRTFFTKGKFKLELSTSGNVYYGKLHIAYVHQLQNLHFALSGEELIIKD